MSKRAYILWSAESCIEIAASFDREALKVEAENHLKRALAEDVNLQDQTPSVGEFRWNGDTGLVRVGFRGCASDYWYTIVEVLWLGDK